MSDGVSEEALAALQNTLSTLLGGAVPAGLARSLSIRPSRIRPLGLGGYVGRNETPAASLLGRRIAARVNVDVSGGDELAARQYLATLAGQVLAQTRAEFASRGIHRIQGLPSSEARQAAFDVDYEYIRIPVASEGLIETLALETFNNVTPYRTQLVADFAGATLATAAQPLADFAPASDAQAAPAGAWSVSAAVPAAIVQTAASAGGNTALADTTKAGAQLLWRPRGRAFDLPRFVVSLAFSSSGPDGVGLVFQRRADDDYRFFLASQRHGYHCFGRRRAGGWQIIASSPFGFATNRTQRLAISVFDGQLVAELDERRSLVALDPDADSGGGEIGLLTHANNTARFHGGRLMQLI